jgi:formylglycine-generating enzyme required for sulfatase activity
LALVVSAPLVGRYAVAQDQAGKRVALLVGVNKYDNRKFRDLEYAERDVEELAKVLEPAGYEVHLLTGSGRGDKRAELKNIAKAIEAVLTRRKKEDLVLVALAGHGLQIEITGSDGKLRAESFYCPADAVQGEPTTMLAMGKLFEEIDRRGGGHNLVLVDACREDPTRGRGLDGSKVAALPEGMAVLFGCRSGQKTFETKNAGGGHGVLFHFVLEGLRGAAKNDEGDITWDRLTEFVRTRVSREAPRLVGDDGIRQTPNLIANLPGESPVLLKPMASSTASTFAGTKAGQEWSDNGLKMTFCWCPPGKYSMGSPAGESFLDNETQHTVALTRGFWLGKYEVTQGQWKTVLDTQPWSGKELVKGGSDYPATYVSWDDAAEFCRKLTEHERRAGRLPPEGQYALPTEAQWEYACRAGTKTRFHFGDDEASLGSYAWFRENANDTGEKYAHQAGQKRANDWGLHDMHGNVWEWCQDWYRKDYEKLAADDPVNLVAGSDRVIRGGCWNLYPVRCRSSDRDVNKPSDRSSDIGFRVVRVR